MKKISSLIFLGFISTIILLPHIAQAMCPICTIAAAGGVELSRYLGIDDTITGLWIGGLTVSFILWTEDYLDKKNIRFKGRIFANILFYLLLIIIPLYYMKVIGQSSNAMQFLGMDKLTFGAAVGAVSFWLGGSWYEYIKDKNGGHAWFPFQKVIMPITPLLLMSFIFYFIIK